jgi:hypothetical protein
MHYNSCLSWDSIRRQEAINPFPDALRQLCNHLTPLPVGHCEEIHRFEVVDIDMLLHLIPTLLKPEHSGPPIIRNCVIT